MQYHHQELRQLLGPSPHTGVCWSCKQAYGYMSSWLSSSCITLSYNGHPLPHPKVSLSYRVTPSLSQSAMILQFMYDSAPLISHLSSHCITSYYHTCFTPQVYDIGSMRRLQSFDFGASPLCVTVAAVKDAHPWILVSGLSTQ